MSPPRIPKNGKLLTLVLLWLASPTSVYAGAGLDVAPWSAGPFVLLLLSIALMPLFAGHWWHANRNKALVAIILAVPVVAYLWSLGPVAHELLLHEMTEYVSFICLLTALYVISGGIIMRGDIAGHPFTNTLFLAGGALLANLIGTTGASMVLIRPVLQINSQRRHTRHIPVFFIFSVSNLGGLLTPLGDPPLFLGFLKGVPFAWTLQLWQPWLVANGLLLGLFWLWDHLAYRRENPDDIRRDETMIHPFRVGGLKLNGLLLLGVIGAVLLQADSVGQTVGQALGLGDVTLKRPWPEALMMLCAGLSFTLSPKHHHDHNQFSWGPIAEVAILFAGIFATITPALCLMVQHGDKLGLNHAWQYFWLSGGLSSVLDNAPTYVTFGTLAAQGDDFGALAQQRPLILAAISCGAVFMGANTYIGNGPNFMVKAIAEEAGYAMPSFFGYVAYYVLPVLIPIFLIVTLLFF